MCQRQSWAFFQQGWELVAHHYSASPQHQPDLCRFLCRRFDSDLSRAASLFSQLLKQAHLFYRDRTKSVALESCGECHALLVSCPKQREEVWFDLALLWWAEHYLDCGQSKLLGGFIIGYISSFFLHVLQPVGARWALCSRALQSASSALSSSRYAVAQSEPLLSTPTLPAEN